METILDLENIHSFYGYTRILQGISLKVPRGKLVALLGRNGVGKTTLFRSIMNLSPPEKRKGKVLFKEKDITFLPPHEISRLGISLVPQGRRLFKSLTVLEHLKIANQKKGKWDIDKVLDFFPRLRERIKHRGNELSGGEQQMLAIARALIANPEMLIMDEPSEGLAPLLVREIGQLIKTIKKEGYSILMAEQKLDFALEIANEIYILAKGEIVFKGTPEDIASNQEIIHKYLGV